MTDQLRDGAPYAELLAALTTGTQMDQDGVFVLVSRQACEEGAALIRSLLSAQSEIAPPHDWTTTPEGGRDHTYLAARLEKASVEVGDYGLGSDMRAAGSIIREYDREFNARLRATPKTADVHVPHGTPADAWRIDRADGSRELVFSPLTDDTYMDEGDEAVALFSGEKFLPLERLERSSKEEG